MNRLLASISREPIQSSYLIFYRCARFVSLCLLVLKWSMFVYQIFSARTRLTEKIYFTDVFFIIFVHFLSFYFIATLRLFFFTSYVIRIQISTVAQLPRNKLLSNKQYEICTTASTADVLPLHTESMTRSMIAPSPEGLSWISQKFLTTFGIRFSTHTLHGIFWKSFHRYQVLSLGYVHEGICEQTVFCNPWYQ